MLEQEAKRLRADAQARLALAWHTAAMTRTKRMPRLATLLGVDKPTPADIERARESHADLLEMMGD